MAISATGPILGRLAKLSKPLSSVGPQPHDLLLAVRHAPEYAQPIRKSNDFTAMGANENADQPTHVVGEWNSFGGIVRLAWRDDSGRWAEVPKDAVILTAMVKAKPGEVAAVKEALMSLVGPTRKEPGCLCYNLHQSKADPTQFMFYEQWANKDAFDAHGKTPHMKALGGQLKDKTDKGGGVVFYELLE